MVTAWMAVIRHPDYSNEIEAIIGGFGGHSDLGLSSTDMDNLVAYLLESSTSEPQ